MASDGEARRAALAGRGPQGKQPRGRVETVRGRGGGARRALREPRSVVWHNCHVYADTATACSADDEILAFVPIAMLLIAPAKLFSPPATIE
jgi:hypothetical protein